ncbi:hypothetical protein [Paraburkholderia xenovorans]
MLQQVTFSPELVKALAISASPLKVSEKWGLQNQRVVAQAVTNLQFRD